MRWNEPVNDPVIAAVRFQATQLSRARELQGISKKELASRIEKTPSAVTQFESGAIKPDPQTLARIALALGMSVGFFSREPEVEELKLDQCHFRSLRSVSQYLRRQVIRSGEIAFEVMKALENEGVEFPPEKVSDIKERLPGVTDIEEAALRTREVMGIGLGPIPDVIPHLEKWGIRVLPIKAKCAEVDAFSMWYEQVPFMMLGLEEKPASRTHFDAAHEFGHLILHDDVLPGDPEAEQEANAFGSAFLLPQVSFGKECPTYYNYEIFYHLKQRWRVSIQALLVRAYHLGKLSQASYRRAFMDLNRRGERKREQGEWTLKKPEYVKKALELLEAEDGITLQDIAKQLGLPLNIIQDILSPIL